MPKLAEVSSPFFGLLAANLVGDRHSEHLGGQPEDSGKWQRGESGEEPDERGCMSWNERPKHGRHEQEEKSCENQIK